MGIGPGDEVITVAHTFTATAEAIALTGARPVFVDVLPDTMLMDPDAIEPAITPRTRAIVAVHLYGQPCDMDRVMAVARRHGLKVVEDAAQAHGAAWRGRRPGALGDAASFSFYPGKNLGAYGDGGAVVSADEALVERIRMLADHGRSDKYTHAIVGVNSRLDGLQAAVLRVKLRCLDAWNAARQRHAELYLQMLRRADVELPVVDPNARSVWHLFVVRADDRADLQARLSEHGIASGVHYPIPLHLQPAYAHLGVPAGALPESERAAARVLSLPMYAELPEEAIARVATLIADRAAERAGAAVGVAAG
jgi:dTDP-4-amino-4,6-dideoxygalactose transaminase